MQDQLSYKITKGSISIISKEGITLPSNPHFNITGLIVFSAINAPFLNLINDEPLVVPPSGNIRRGKYFPVVSIKSYLSLIWSRIYALFSSVPPLGIYIESITFAILLIIGALLNAISNENANR